MIVLQSIDKARNRQRWYEIEQWRDLFGYHVRVRYGRIGQKTRQSRPYGYATEEEAEKAVRRILRLRKQHGYREVPQKPLE